MLSIGMALTVIIQLVLTSEPSVATAEIVAVPGPIAVTSPLASIVATSVLDEDHIMLLFVAFSGSTEVVRRTVSVTLSIVEPLAEMLMLSIGVALTVTLQVALVPDPSVAVAVIVALPTPMAVTIPLEFTMATFSFEDDQIMPCSVAV